MSFSNGNWQSQYVLFFKMLHFFGPSASIYCPGAIIIIIICCPGAAIICPNANIFCSIPACYFHFRTDRVEHYASEMQIRCRDSLGQNIVRLSIPVWKWHSFKVVCQTVKAKEVSQNDKLTNKQTDRCYLDHYLPALWCSQSIYNELQMNYIWIWMNKRQTDGESDNGRPQCIKTRCAPQLLQYDITAASTAIQRSYIITLTNKVGISYCLPELALGRSRITDRLCVSVLCLSVLTGIELISFMQIP